MTTGFVLLDQKHRGYAVVCLSPVITGLPGNYGIAPVTRRSMHWYLIFVMSLKAKSTNF